MKGGLALTYFLTRSGQYHGRGGVSRSCSGREGVVPPCYGHQTKLVCCEWGWGAALLDARRGRSKGDGAVMNCLQLPMSDAQGYRVKPHGQLVLVS